ncbi:sporulation protein [Halorhabdus amylolytica]|uniref:sporulation protein n=1 Tax=Halorhabdus amylolytica TaxID=2559573 RepID=UPI0010AA4CD8|nr:sporulation protein [Halorhabdus amylolytica]
MGLLNRIGVGSAEVDTILETETVQPGDSISAHIEIEGGSDDQEVDEIELAVMTRYEVETDEGSSYSTGKIMETTLAEEFTITAGEERTIDAGEIQIPESTPPTIGKTQAWIYTGLDIDWSVDPKDKDHLEVRPGPYLDGLVEAVENLGFSRSSVDNVKARSFGPGTFAQEFEYKPRSGPYSGKLDEIELFPVRQGDALTVVVEVDERGESMFGSDESQHRITVDTTDPAAIEQQLRDLIDRQL